MAEASRARRKLGASGDEECRGRKGVGKMWVVVQEAPMSTDREQVHLIMRVTTRARHQDLHKMRVPVRRGERLSVATQA